MPSRRSKRTPAQNKNERGKSNQKRKAKELSEEQTHALVANGSQRSTRKRLKAVNYKEVENSSGDDESNGIDDPDYKDSDKEDREFEVGEKRQKTKQDTRKMKTNNSSVGAIEEKTSNPESDVIKTKGSFEVSNLKTEINLSSDEESDAEDEKVGATGKGNGGNTEEKSQKISLNYKEEEKEEVKVEKKDERFPSKSLKRKTSLFDDSDMEEDPDDDLIKDGKNVVNVSKGGKRIRKAVVKIKRAKMTSEEHNEEKNADTQNSVDDMNEEHPSRPRRKCRISSEKPLPPKTDSKEVKGNQEKVEKTAVEKKKRRAKKGMPNEKTETSSLAQEKVEDGNQGEPPESTIKKEEGADLSESSDDEWEDVEDVLPDGSPKKKKQPQTDISSGLEIDIELPGAANKKRKAYDWKDFFRRQLNRFNKDRQIELHKVHLLCLLANGFHRNKICNEQLLQGAALSFIPPHIVKAKPKKLTIDFVYKLSFWFMKHFTMDRALSSCLKFPVYQLLQAMQEKKLSSEEMVIVFVLCIRALGEEARLVYSFQPMTWKADIIEKNSKGKKSKSSSCDSSPLTPSPKSNKKNGDDRKMSSNETPRTSTKPTDREEKTKARRVKKGTDVKQSLSKKSTKKTLDSESATKRHARKNTFQRPKPAGKKRTELMDEESDDQEDDFEEAKETPQRRLTSKGRQSSAKKRVTTEGTKQSKEKGMKMEEDEEEIDDQEDDFEEAKETPRRRLTSKGRRSSAKKRVTTETKKQSKEKGMKMEEDEEAIDDQEDDFEEAKETPQRRLTSKGRQSSAKKRVTSETKKQSKEKGMKMEEDEEEIDDQEDDFKEAKETPQRRLTSKGRRSSAKKGVTTEGTKQSKEKGMKVEEDDEEDDSSKEVSRPKRNLRKRTVKKRNIPKGKPKREDINDEESELSSEGSNYSEEEWIHQKKSATKKIKRRKQDLPLATKQRMDSDSDFDIETLSLKKTPKSSSKLKKNYKILSSDSDACEEGAKKESKVSLKDNGIDVWCEVFIPAENIWVSVDCLHGFVNKPNRLEALATNPLLYVVGFDNDNCAKDVTQRYATRWMEYNIKLRIEKFDKNWWSETLSRYKNKKKKKRDKEEDEQMQAHNLDQPLPKSIVEYKNHPLYALERHLLKFEAIYPPSAAVLGYCKGEPVYSRECVHILKSRQTWMKEARVVKDGEKPYKFVKKLVNPFKRHLLTPEEQNQMLDIYGEWQTEEYVPPPAKDGIVPRNEYGNVELFKPSMLPKGTVHLKIPGLNKVASKLDIDCAPAMMGWEFHKRFACPILDGFVVCEEFADILVAAWEEDQLEQEKKRKLKREQRAMKNWKHLIKSILIRERLKEKYQLEEETEAQETKETKGKGNGKKKEKKATPATKASWPQNKMTAFEGDASNLLPFEKKSAKR